MASAGTLASNKTFWKCPCIYIHKYCGNIKLKKVNESAKVGQLGLVNGIGQTAVSFARGIGKLI